MRFLNMFRPIPIIWFLGFLIFVGAGGWSARAGEIKVEVQLVWGTNQEKSPDPSHKPVEASLAKKLAHLKWKNYFQVNRQEVVIPSRQMRRITLSPQCEIEITELEGPRVEVKVYGRTAEAATKNQPFKWVHKHVEQLPKDETLVFAGDDKNDCAWAIVIRRLK